MVDCALGALWGHRVIRIYHRVDGLVKRGKVKSTRAGAEGVKVQP